VTPPPTVRQIYALAAAPCERMGEEFPENKETASETIERIRTENGRPSPRLDGGAGRSGPRGRHARSSCTAEVLAEEME
jgi:hypothetical protein